MLPEDKRGERVVLAELNDALFTLRIEVRATLIVRESEHEILSREGFLVVVADNGTIA